MFILELLLYRLGLCFEECNASVFCMTLVPMSKSASTADKELPIGIKVCVGIYHFCCCMSSSLGIGYWAFMSSHLRLITSITCSADMLVYIDTTFKEISLYLLRIVRFLINLLTSIHGMVLCCFLE